MTTLIFNNLLFVIVTRVRSVQVECVTAYNVFGAGFFYGCSCRTDNRRHPVPNLVLATCHFTHALITNNKFLNACIRTSMVQLQRTHGWISRLQMVKLLASQNKKTATQVLNPIKFGTFSFVQNILGNVGIYPQQWIKY